ncbi:MAG: hypothetical protein EXR98_07415 [Gemmataceae bacterium]|nr:hypothetical protein [Gemmataceae bacterium]
MNWTLGFKVMTPPPLPGGLNGLPPPPKPPFLPPPPPPSAVPPPVVGVPLPPIPPPGLAVKRAIACCV